MATAQQLRDPGWLPGGPAEDATEVVGACGLSRHPARHASVFPRHRRSARAEAVTDQELRDFAGAAGVRRVGDAVASGGAGGVGRPALTARGARRDARLAIRRIVRGQVIGVCTRGSQGGHRIRRMADSGDALRRSIVRGRCASRSQSLSPLRAGLVDEGAGCRDFIGRCSGSV